MPYTEALEHYRAWITGKGATTRSARALTSLLLSLANEGDANLSEVRILDTDRRLWLVNILLHLPTISNNELRYAAGQAWADD